MALVGAENPSIETSSIWRVDHTWWSKCEQAPGSPDGKGLTGVQNCCGECPRIRTGPFVFGQDLPPAPSIEHNEVQLYCIVSRYATGGSRRMESSKSRSCFRLPYSFVLAEGPARRENGVCGRVNSVPEKGMSSGLPDLFSVPGNVLVDPVVLH